MAVSCEASAKERVDKTREGRNERKQQGGKWHASLQSDKTPSAIGRVACLCSLLTAVLTPAEALLLIDMPSLLCCSVGLRRKV